MDFELSEEQRAIAATVRDFVRRELVPHEDLVERLDAVPLAVRARPARPADGHRAAFAGRAPLEVTQFDIAGRA